MESRAALEDRDKNQPDASLRGPIDRCCLMRWTPADLLRDFEAFGLQFKSLCVRDLRVYAEANDGTLFHYRDKTGWRRTPSSSSPTDGGRRSR